MLLKNYMGRDAKGIKGQTMEEAISFILTDVFVS